MNEGASKTSIKALLDEFGLRPKRSLGQNFLADAGLCAKIAALAAVGEPGAVLEIGAGLGALTDPLLRAGNRVVAIETDGALVTALNKRFDESLTSGQLVVLKADAREIDLREQIAALPGPRVLAGNLPYHLSGLLLRRVVEASDLLDLGVFLLQLEVVDRLCAQPASGAYGALSVFAQAVFEPRKAFVVRRGAFYPQPNVDSAVVTLTPLPHCAPITAAFTQLVRAAFGQRRKTLRNAWKGVAELSVDALTAAAQRANIDLGARGETLSVTEFQAMARQVEAMEDAQ